MKEIDEMVKEAFENGRAFKAIRIPESRDFLDIDVIYYRDSDTLLIGAFSCFLEYNTKDKRVTDFFMNGSDGFYAIHSFNQFLKALKAYDYYIYYDTSMKLYRLREVNND